MPSFAIFPFGVFMSQPDRHTLAHQPEDVVESIVPMMPVVLPMAGAVLIFLLAFIAVSMA
jgi:hypothetical protein